MVALLVGFPSGNPPKIGTFTAKNRTRNRTWTGPPEYAREYSFVSTFVGEFVSQTSLLPTLCVCVCLSLSLFETRLWLPSGLFGEITACR